MTLLPYLNVVAHIVSTIYKANKCMKTTLSTGVLRFLVCCIAKCATIDDAGVYHYSHEWLAWHMATNVACFV